MSRLAAVYVASRLGLGCVGADGAVAPACTPRALPAGAGAPARAGLSSARVAADPDDTSRAWERCYTSGDELPISGPTEWALVDDEAGGAKGVRKLG